MKRAAQPVEYRRLPKESLERFLRDLDIDYLADDTFSFSEDHFVRLTVRDIDTRMDNRLLPLFVPSKDGVNKERIFVTVKGRKWMLVSAQRLYINNRCVIRCVDTAYDSAESKGMPLTISLLRQRMGIEIEEDDPRFYIPPRQETWLRQMRRVLTAGVHSR